MGKHRDKLNALPLPLAEIGELLNAEISLRSDSDCWVWTGPTNPNEVPRLGLYQESTGRIQQYSVIRLMYQYFYEITDLQELPRFQLCNKNRLCVNPAHTLYVTRHKLGGRCNRYHDLTAETTEQAPDGRILCVTCRTKEKERSDRRALPPSWEDQASSLVAEVWGENRTLPKFTGPILESESKGARKAGKARWKNATPKEKRDFMQRVRAAKTPVVDDAHYARIFARLRAGKPIELRVADRQEAERTRSKVLRRATKEGWKLTTSYNSKKSTLHLSKKTE